MTIDTLDTDAMNAITNLSNAMSPIATTLLGVTIVITGLRIAEGAEGITRNAVRLLATAGITSFAIANWGSLANAVLQSGSQLAQLAEPVSSFDFSKPTSSVNLYFGICIALFQNVNLNPLSILSPIGFAAFFTWVAYGLILTLMVLLAAFVGIYHAYLLLGTKIMVVYGFCLLPFGMLSATSKLTNRAIEILAAEGLRVFMFCLIIGMTAQDFTTLAANLGADGAGLGAAGTQLAALVGVILEPLAVAALIVFLPNQVVRHIQGAVELV